MGLEPKDIEDIQSKSDDFSAYFDSNRLYFPNSSIREIQSIHGRVESLIKLMQYFMGLLVDFDDASPEYLRQLNHSLNTLDFVKRKVIKDERDFLLLFSEFAQEMNRQAERLEYLYKTIVDIQ
ncbi:MAG: hypothetical protein EHM20_18355 [Alphaproteobacteria bacterium]|nr:MAG: hypothetical protein EHM20_18355 [Alphaproteobacteria bacterium]